MPCFPHQGLPTSGFYSLGHVACAFHVINHGGTRVSLNDIASEQDKLAVGVNDFTILGYNPKAVTIAINSPSVV